MSVINILINSIQKRNFSVIVKKIFKRFENDSSIEAGKWANDNSISIDDYCNNINPHMWQESVEACNQIESQGMKNLYDIDKPRNLAKSVTVE